MSSFFENKKHILPGVLLIFLCFFMTSTGYLSWLYHLIEIAPPNDIDLYTLGFGYIAQAVGIGIFAFLTKKNPGFPGTRSLAVSLVAYTVLIAPSVLIADLTGTIIFGVLSNVFCGMIAGFYLHELAARTDARYTAVTFGMGYGLATLASWLLALIGGRDVYDTAAVFIICIVLTIIILIVKSRSQSCASNGARTVKQAYPFFGKILAVACIVVFLFSIVNHIGFSFPSSDIGNGVNLELSRLFYAAGLILAGVSNNKNRRRGAVLTLAALVIPFITLTLRGEIVSSTILWSVSYFASGFFSVYRIILFTDLAKNRKVFYISGFGLMFGRLGESLGSIIYLNASAYTVPLVTFAAVLFVITIFLFFWLYQKIYMPEADREKHECELFRRFTVTHDLSPREREILTLLLAKETTSSIAEQLFVSESTVKFHVHNILQKTGCRSRKELVELFYSQQ